MAESPSHQRHRQAAAGRSVGCAVITVSDSRTPETDASGRLLQERLTGHGHTVLFYRILPDESEPVGAVLQELLARADIEAVLLNGGTGIARRDRTYDVVAGLLDKVLPGFGELFRMLSWEQVGSAAMLSRAIAGVAGGTLLFSLPGSPKAVELAADKLILPELEHLVWELSREG